MPQPSQHVSLKHRAFFRPGLIDIVGRESNEVNLGSVAEVRSCRF